MEWEKSSHQTEPLLDFQIQGGLFVKIIHKQYMFTSISQKLLKTFKRLRVSFFWLLSLLGGQKPQERNTQHFKSL